jgi:hypothetical protein
MVFLSRLVSIAVYTVEPMVETAESIDPATPTAVPISACESIAIPVMLTRRLPSYHCEAAQEEEGGHCVRVFGGGISTGYMSQVN